MNKRKASKIALIILIVAAQVLLVGAGWFAVELRNADSKNRLVNIEALIGGSGMPDPSKIPQAEQEQAEDSEETSSYKQPDISTEIIVKVRGENIFIDGEVVTSLSAFETSFEKKDGASKDVKLIDDYADYQTFSKLIDYLKDNGKILNDDDIEELD